MCVCVCVNEELLKSINRNFVFSTQSSDVNISVWWLRDPHETSGNGLQEKRLHIATFYTTRKTK